MCGSTLRHAGAGCRHVVTCHGRTETLSSSMLSIAQLLAQYLHHHPDESDKLARLVALTAHTTDASELVARTNFVGHVTASGFVLNADCSAVLLVHHRGLDMYLQPGGHVDPDEQSLLDAARREIREETGLEVIDHVPTFTDFEIPFDIDSHYIPPNPRKGEPEHWHHDFRYVFHCPANTELTLAQHEVAAARWVPLDQLDQYPTFPDVAKKLSQIASAKAEKLKSRIINGGTIVGAMGQSP